MKDKKRQKAKGIKQKGKGKRIKKAEGTEAEGIRLRQGCDGQERQKGEVRVQYSVGQTFLSDK